MKFKLASIALVASAWMHPAHAADVVASTAANTTASTGTITNATTIAASAAISPGSYAATIVPSFNSAMAGRLEKAVAKVPGVTSVTSHAQDSSLHFTVKNGAIVRVADIQKAVVKADTGAVMSAPILEHSLNANPGL